MFDSFARGFAACLIVTTPPLWAQSADITDAAAIDLPEAIDRTLERSPELKAQGFEISAAEGRLLQSEFRPSPELAIRLEDVLGTNELRGVHGAETSVTLGWTRASTAPNGWLTRGSRMDAQVKPKGDRQEADTLTSPMPQGRQA